MTNLLLKIEHKREEVIEKGKRLGLVSLETIHASQELDQLMNKYSKVQVTK